MIVSLEKLKLDIIINNRNIRTGFLQIGSVSKNISQSIRNKNTNNNLLQIAYTWPYKLRYIYKNTQKNVFVNRHE